jgi:four helix bundle protein
MAIARFEQLESRQEAHKLVLLVDKNPYRFPPDESRPYAVGCFCRAEGAAKTTKPIESSIRVRKSCERSGLVSPIKRVTVSGSANLAEAFKWLGLGDKARFYNLVQGALAERCYSFIFCYDLGYPSKSDSLIGKAEQVGRMLNAFSKSFSGG